MHTHPYSIRYWPTWAAIAVLWCLSHLPFAWQLAIGRCIGRTFHRLAARRRAIAAVNLSMCFPELSDGEREKILAEQFISMGIGVLEMAMSWWASARRLKRLARIEGLEHLHAALDSGKGVILLSAHFTTLEMGGRLLALHAPFHVTRLSPSTTVISTPGALALWIAPAISPASSRAGITTAIFTRER